MNTHPVVDPSGQPPVVTGDVDDDGIGWITLDRPGRLNAVTVELAQQLEDHVLRLAGTARVLVIQGAGGNFCAGGDFQEVIRLRDQGPDALRGLFEAFGRACDAVAHVAVPVVAAVEGHAMAGGFELVQACDIVLVANDAVLCDNHVNHGAIPGGGGSQRLPRLVGRARALAHMLSGESLSGRDAVNWGIAHRSWPTAEFAAGVEDFVGRLARRSPGALAGIKCLVRDGLAMPLADGLEMERTAIVEHLYGAGADDIDRAGQARSRP